MAMEVGGSSSSTRGLPRPSAGSSLPRFLGAAVGAASQKLPALRPDARPQQLPCPELDALLALGSTATTVQVSSVLEPQLEAWRRNPRAATMVLKGLARNRLADISVHVISFMQASRLEANVFHFSSAISACEKAQKWQLALDLLGLMSDTRVAADQICYNAAISACSRGGEWQLALSLLSTMPERRAMPDKISYSAAISACEKGGEWQLALSLLSTMIHMRVMPDEINFSAAISACEKGGQWQLALSLLHSMPDMQAMPDKFSYSAAISACEKGGQWQLALNLLSDMPDMKVMPDKVNYNAAISACEKGGEWQLALSLLSNVPESMLMPDAIAYSAAISACSKGGQWQLALGLLHNMPDRKVMPNEIAYSAAISACEKGGQWQLGLGLLHKMSEVQISRNVISFNAAMSACEKAGQWEQALSLLSSMCGVELSPNEISYTAVISACEKTAAWEPAMALLHNMLENQLVPTGLQAGSVASSVSMATGKDAAFKLLEALLKFWLEQEHLLAGQGSLQVAGLDDLGDLLTAGGAFVRTFVGVVGHGPGIAAIFKPAGVTTEVAVRQVSEWLTRQRQVPTPVDLHVVSRLDHPTSGVLPVALGSVGSAAANWLEAQFAGRLVRKEYLCLCEGPSLGPPGSQGNVSTPLQTVESDAGRVSRTQVSDLGRQAFTGYEVLARYVPPVSSDPSLPRQDSEGMPGVLSGHDAEGTESHELMLLRVRPLTGRTHQIRVHMASIGRPLVGDLTYGAKGAAASLRSCPRLFLHCRRIDLRDLAGQPFIAEAKLPQELDEVLAQLQPVAEQDSKEITAW